MKLKLAATVAAAMLGTTALTQTNLIPAGLDFELYDKECAVYFAAARVLEAQGVKASAAMTVGCPESASSIPVDIVRQEESARFTNSVAGEIFQRMIARGMPETLARNVAMSPAFAELVEGYSSKQ